MNKIKILLLCISPLILSAIITYPTFKKNKIYHADKTKYNFIISSINIQNSNLKTLEDRKDTIINEIDKQKKLQDEKNNLASEITKINEEIANLNNQINEYNNNISITQNKLNKINSFIKN